MPSKCPPKISQESALQLTEEQVQQNIVCCDVRTEADRWMSSPILLAKKNS
jgi:hypothetical protein